MSPERWRDVERVVSGALELPDDQQTGYLNNACASCPELRAEAESLLAVRGCVEGFLERPPPTTLDGCRTGAYRLVREIGKGGMGTVYLAERDDLQFQKRVAVKVVSGVQHSPEAERRFRSERQILAALEHPNIARLLDAGVTVDGVAYLVMEYIEGRPMLEYCSKLPLAECLQIFRGVCAAVEFAHQHLIVHRDIKPANVLVTAAGIPKLLDFGIAKILAASPGAEDGVTLAQAHPMTPDYASPEQIRGGMISTVSDVYALGCLLYELLAGQRPFLLAGMRFEEAVRTVCEREPVRPHLIRPQTPADLEAIVQKAMRKLPEERYSSARELSADVGRYLEGRPVFARNKSGGYVLLKLMKRHRTACAAAAAGLLLAAVMATAIVREGRIAERRFQDVRKLAHSLMYELNDGMAALPGSEDVRKLLVTRALDYLDPLAREATGDFGLQMELADAYVRIGSIQGSPNEVNLGDSAGALLSYGKARQILESVLSRRPREIPAQMQYARLLLQIADVHIYLRQGAQVRPEADGSLHVWEQLARVHPEDAQVRGGIAAAYFRIASSLFPQEPLQSIEYLRKALAINERLLAADPSDAERQRSVAVILKTLGTNLFDQLGDARTAREYYVRALDLDTRRAQALPKNSLIQLDISFDLGELANMAKEQGDLDQALNLYERTLAIRKNLAALDPRNARLSGRVAYALLRVSEVRYRKGQASEALQPLREAESAAAALVAANPADSVDRAYMAEAWLRIGEVQERLARPVEACTAFGRAIQVFDELHRRSAVSEDERTMAELARTKAARDCGGNVVTPSPTRAIAR